MDKEFCLSGKIELYWRNSGDEGEEFYTHEGYCYKEQDVKEFIRRLKEINSDNFLHYDRDADEQIFFREDFINEINKLAGEKLI